MRDIVFGLIKVFVLAAVVLILFVRKEEVEMESTLKDIEGKELLVNELDSIMVDNGYSPLLNIANWGQIIYSGFVYYDECRIDFNPVKCGNATLLKILNVKE